MDICLKAGLISLVQAMRMCKELRKKPSAMRCR